MWRLMKFSMTVGFLNMITGICTIPEEQNRRPLCYHAAGDGGCGRKKRRQATFGADGGDCTAKNEGLQWVVTPRKFPVEDSRLFVINFICATCIGDGGIVDRKTILLVEDDGILRDLIKGALDLRYNVLEAPTCSEAMKKIRQPVDLALIDYSLPDGNGLDILEEIREADPALPVIMMTAYSTENLAINSFRSGATDYLRKPFTFAYLMGTLSEILEGKKNRRQQDRAASRDVFTIDCIAAFIEMNYEAHLTRDKLAARARMDKYRFSKVFNDRFGQGLKPYLNAVRTRKAVELLQNRELDITQIAFSVGYGSVSHFCRVFKDSYGLSPAVYRERVLFT